jgi:hypothetical protein
MCELVNRLRIIFVGQINGLTFTASSSDKDLIFSGRFGIPYANAIAMCSEAGSHHFMTLTARPRSSAELSQDLAINSVQSDEYFPLLMSESE